MPSKRYILIAVILSQTTTATTTGAAAKGQQLVRFCVLKCKTAKVAAGVGVEVSASLAAAAAVVVVSNKWPELQEYAQETWQP